MERKKKVVLLGATGSIGENALKVIESHPDRIELIGVACRSNYAEMAKIVSRLRVPWAAIGNEEAAEEARQDGIFPAETRILSGMEEMAELAALPEADVVLSAIVGDQGLRPTLAAIEAGKDIALASKEILVLAGKFVMEAARRKGVSILPVDSEHSAIFQCLDGRGAEQVRRLILTASGGPFLDTPLEEMDGITPDAALRHPNWEMGTKVTIDSATMANKGLELIEARWLFDARPDQVEAVIHPQSIVHSFVEFVDGSTLAQLSPPSMTFAIQYALLYPERAPGVEPGVDFSAPFQLDFLPPDLNRFPCLELARFAMEAGGVAPAIFHAANEAAVEAFLQERLRFVEIPAAIRNTLEGLDNFEPGGIEDILQAGKRARNEALSFIATQC